MFTNYFSLSGRAEMRWPVTVNADISRHCCCCYCCCRCQETNW